MLGQASSEIGIQFTTVQLRTRGATKLALPRAPLFRYSVIQRRVCPEMRLSSSPRYLSPALKAREGQRICAPTYPKSFHLRSSTVRLRLLVFTISARIPADWCEILLFLRSSNSRNRRVCTSRSRARSPEGPEPRLFHSAWKVTRLGQWSRAVKMASKPSESMLLPLISRCSSSEWYSGRSCARVSAPSLPRIRSLSMSRSVPACSTISFCMLCLLQLFIQIPWKLQLLSIHNLHHFCTNAPYHIGTLVLFRNAHQLVDQCQNIGQLCNNWPQQYAQLNPKIIVLCSQLRDPCVSRRPTKVE